VPEEVAIKRALFYFTSPDYFPRLLHPTASYTPLPILTLHKPPPQKTINLFSFFHPCIEEGKKIE
jgi:hypothetical protein